MMTQNTYRIKHYNPVHIPS